MVVLMEAYQQFGMTPTLLVKRAGINLGNGEWQKAIDDCKLVLDNPDVDPSSSPAGGARAITQEAKVGMAKEIFGNGEAIRGVKLLQEVYFEDPSSSNAITLGVFANLIGQSNRSEIILKDAINKDPNNAVLKNILGISC